MIPTEPCKNCKVTKSKNGIRSWKPCKNCQEGHLNQKWKCTGCNRVYKEKDRIVITSPELVKAYYKQLAMTTGMFVIKKDHINLCPNCKLDSPAIGVYK